MIMNFHSRQEAIAQLTTRLEYLQRLDAWLLQLEAIDEPLNRETLAMQYGREHFANQVKQGGTNE